MSIFDILQLVGGIGLFLYGMKYLGASLEHMAGVKLEKTLEKLTDNRIKGFSMGIAVTAVIQSSSATTIMLVGFVNAGIMKLVQTVPVLLGANIGTTATGQILRLGDISSGGSLIFDLLKPSSFSPLLIGIAAFIMLMSKKKKANDIASLLMGFGVLFFGMNTMEKALEPLSSSASFQSAFTSFSNPFIGFFLGIVLSMILQSASAAVGILQAVTTTGNVTMAVAIPVIAGISIGKLFPILLASIGTKKEAQRVTLSQFLISTIGAVLTMLVIYLVLSPLGLISWDKVMTRGNIADINTILNICVSLLFLPFCQLIVKLAKLIIKSSQPSKIDEELALLDDIFLKTPTLALDQSFKVINSMGNTAIENYNLAVSTHSQLSDNVLKSIDENEQFLDKSETCLNDYMVKVTAQPLHTEQQKLATEIMHSVMDFERIGDHCVKISEVAAYNKNAGITFSDKARYELDVIFSAVSEILETTVAAFNSDDEVLALNVEPLEELIESMGEEIKERHVERLQTGNCTVQSGISLVEVLTCLERISAYCSNVALHIIEKHSDMTVFDMHAYAKEMHNSSSVYKNLYDQYCVKYLDKLDINA